MDSEASLCVLLTTAGFGARLITAIVDFLCQNLNELSDMSSKDLDIGIHNIHKSMATLATKLRVFLNISKSICLHSIRLYFYNYTRCANTLHAADIVVLLADDISSIKEYVSHNHFFAFHDSYIVMANLLPQKISCVLNL